MSAGNEALETDMRFTTTALIISVALTSAGCKKEAPERDDKKSDAETIAFSASIAASLHVDAERACTIAGVVDVEKCSAIEGHLIPEREARIAAKLSLGQTREYFNSCVYRKKFGENYCNNLIARAIAMERRRPITDHIDESSTDQ